MFIKSLKNENCQSCNSQNFTVFLLKNGDKKCIVCLDNEMGGE